MLGDEGTLIAICEYIDEAGESMHFYEFDDVFRIFTLINILTMY